MTHAVVFDLDGTLVDHQGAVEFAFRRWLRRQAALPLDAAGEQELLAVWRRLERVHMDAYLAGECSFAEQRRRRVTALLQRIAVPVPAEEQLDALLLSYLVDYEAAWRAYPDVVPCLETLASRRPRPILGVLTNGDTQQQTAKVERLGLRRYFTAIVTSGDLGVAKPLRDCFIRTCAAFGTRPRDTVYVGDLLQVDAVPAHEAGLRAVWLDRSERGVSPAGISRITSLVDLPDVLQG